MQKLDRLVWATSTTLRIGEYHIGVRSNTNQTDALLRQAFSTLVDDTVEAPANYSVILSPANRDNGGPRGLHLLYHDSTAVVRTRYPRRVLAALRSYLSGHLEHEGPSGGPLIDVNAVALVRDGQAVLVPSITLIWVDLLSPRLHRKGIQFVDSPHVTVDPVSGELVVDPPTLPINDTVEFDGIDSARPGREPPPVSPGRYPIKGWAFYTKQGDERGRLSPGFGVFVAIRSVRGFPDVSPSRDVGYLTELFSRVPALAISSPYEGDLASNLAAVLDHDLA